MVGLGILLLILFLARGYDYFVSVFNIFSLF